MTVAELRAAAFHGGPADPGMIARGADGKPAERWLAGVVLGAQGRYAAAYALLEPLCALPDLVLSSLACSTLGSHRRQLGGHDAARRWDAAAVARAARTTCAASNPPCAATTPPCAASTPLRGGDPDGMDPRGALADGLLGLAADALALGRLKEARTLAARAEGPAEGCWRTATRHAWVSAELALAAGDPASARAPAEAAARLARAHAADRHAVKSDIVLAVALSTGGIELDRAGELLRTALATASRHGWRSLSWPAAYAASAMDPAGEPSAKEVRSVRDLREYAGAVLHGVLQATDPAGREIAVSSPWVPKFGIAPS